MIFIVVAKVFTTVFVLGLIASALIELVGSR